jgi:hypothetical protein
VFSGAAVTIQLGCRDGLDPNSSRMVSRRQAMTELAAWPDLKAPSFLVRSSGSAVERSKEIAD